MLGFVSLEYQEILAKYIDKHAYSFRCSTYIHEATIHLNALRFTKII